jgi:hypothetical protein
MTAINRVPRSRGALSGLLLLLLGAWAALAPFVGPSADFGYSPGNDTWIWTDGRGLFSVLPGAVAAFGGMLLLVSASRVAAALGAGLAVVSGAWLVVGPSLAPLWNGPSIGAPLGTGDRTIAEQLALFTGVGLLIVYLGAMALGRLAVVGVRETRIAERSRAVPEPDAPEPTAPLPAYRDTDPAPEVYDDGYTGRPDASVPQGRYALDREAPVDQKVAGARYTRPDR